MTVLTLAEAEDLAARTLAAILPGCDCGGLDCRRRIVERERVASDLEGLRRHVPLLMYFEADPTGIPYCRACDMDDAWPCPDARRYSDNLRHTAELYGVQP